jgi:hypothetical protein
MNYEANGSRPDPITIAQRFISIVGGLEEARDYIKIAGTLCNVRRPTTRKAKGKVK